MFQDVAYSPYPTFGVSVIRQPGFLLRNEPDHIKRIQSLGSKSVIDLRRFGYEKRLQRLTFFSLVYRDQQDIHMCTWRIRPVYLVQS